MGFNSMRHHPPSLVSFSFLLLVMAFIGSLPLSPATAQDSAIGLLKQMITIAADNGGVGRTDELNALKQRINALPKPARGDKQKARIANDNGLAAYKAGQYEQAKEYFLSAYQTDPADAEIAGNLALVYLNLGDSKKVIETLTAALSLAPGRASSWVNLATYYALQDQQREAVACYALTFHFSQNQNKTREFLQKLATNNPDQPKVQQAAQQALQLSLIQGNSGTVATAPARDSLDAPLLPPAPVSSTQPNIPTAPQASTAAPVTPSASPTQPMVLGVQTNVAAASQASTTPPAAPSSIPTQPEATPPTRSIRAIPTAEPQLATPSTTEGGRSQRSQVQERGGKIENSQVQTLIDAKNYIRNIGINVSNNLLSCKGRQEFAFNEWRNNFDSAVNSGGDREVNVRGLDTKVMGFYQKIQSKISDQEIVEGKRYISLLSYIEKKYADALVENINSLLSNKEKLKSECPNLNEEELGRKYEEVINIAKNIDQIEANDLAQVDNLTKQAAIKATQEENKKKTDAEELVRKVQAEKERVKKESADNIAKATQAGPKVANDIGVKWQFIETKDPMTDEHIMKSNASFSNDSRLNVNIEFECNKAKKELKATATAFDSSGNGVPFIQKNKEVSLLVRLNDNNPVTTTSKLVKYNNQLEQLEVLALSKCYDKIHQSPAATIMLGSLPAGVVFSGQDPEKLVNKVIDDVIAKDPSVSCIANVDFFDDKKNNKLWFELTELRAQFPLANGNVVARIAPYEPNLRKVLEACADVIPQTQLPEPSPSEAKESSSEKKEFSPNSSLFDSIKIQGKPLAP